MKKVYLSVVIPSYNETENLRRGVLEEVKSYLSKQKYSWEVIVSDDASPDEESRRLAKDFCDRNRGFTYLQNQHGGKPLAVWAGIQKAVGELVLFTDMDQSTPIGELEKLLPYFDRGFDVVIGSRGLERKNFSLFRQLASFIFRNIRRSVLLRKIVDTQAGFKCLRASVAREIFPVMDVIASAGKGSQGWTVTSFDVEMLVIAQDRGYKIAEVPVSWADRDISVAKAAERGQGKFIKESIDMLQEVYRVKFNQLRGRYKK
ncbi:MAG: glycosyltransferase [Patescibacteria group bacterium]|nr:glycosyltransferase [Patescibacteria group bacterium]MCL5431537.1 glycosyltransferase [Patescibacteria group bacterium]